ncbi:MAG: LapA family protein [Pyrinomonadaceae bacterium]
MSLSLVRSVMKGLAPALLIIFFVASVLPQAPAAPKYKSQEVSEEDGIPVLIKHLPDWESRRDMVTFATNATELIAGLGERPILNLIDFTAGTEAVAADYDAGKLVIVEYTSPQASVDADAKFTEALTKDPQAGSTAYRRIGNYNAFVFDAANISDANALLDQVKYEKQIHWLGDNPFIITPERAFILTTSDIFMSTVIVIVMGIGFSIVGGLIVGMVYFRLRNRRRAAMTAYTDAGGMTRLNLDGFTPDIVPDRLLGD